MSKGLFWSAGMISSTRLPLALGALAARRAGGGSAKFSREVARGSASPRRSPPSSVFTSTSPQPDTEQCIFAPPISSSVTFSPMTISAMRGRAQVHGGVAVDHDHQVAERGDVGAARPPRARTAGRSAAPRRRAAPRCRRCAPRRGGRGTSPPGR